MTTEPAYDTAEGFQMYTPELQPQQNVYSNSEILDVIEQSNSGDDIQVSDANTQQNRSSDMSDHDHDHDHDQDDNVSNNGSNTSGDGINNCEEDVLEELDADKDEVSNKAASQEVSWNKKLSNNWKRHLRRKTPGTGKKSKKSDNRNSIGGSLSRLVCVESQFIIDKIMSNLYQKICDPITCPPYNSFHPLKRKQCCF